MVGIDEAGRGCVIGPLVLGAVYADEETVQWLRGLGVRDSKELRAPKRLSLAVEIKKVCDTTVVEIPPHVIDSRNINDVELEHTVSLANGEKDIYVDAFTVGIEKVFGSDINCVSEPKADQKYAIVSAASIIAKVRRDAEIKRLHGIFGDFGSGYPSDARTIEFLKRGGLDDPLFARHIRFKWETIKGLRDGRSC